MDFARRNLALLFALSVSVLIVLSPVIESWIFIGSAYPKIPPAYGDEFLYYAQAHAVAQGYFGFGNPYLFEHATDYPLVIFGGTWISSIPLLLHLPLFLSIELNFLVWGLIFVTLAYWLLREIWVPKWLSAAGALFAFLQCSGLIMRMSNRQIVNPVFLLFYVALARFLIRPERFNIVLLGVATGLSFWVFSYLWQTVVITLGMLALYALICREWVLLRATLASSLLGGVIGSPTLIYMFWISHANPYFWESIARFGLVDSHLPMAEVVYSGGWVGAMLALLSFVYWRTPSLRRDRDFLLLCFYLALSGLGLWIMQGSNVITGKLLETGEHIRPFIATWLIIAVVSFSSSLWIRRAHITRAMRIVYGIILGVLTLVSIYFVYAHLKAFLFEVNAPFWKTQQLYAMPYEWLQQNEPNPVVVWGDVHNFSTTELPIFTRHYVLYTQPTVFHLVSNQEIRERYLVASYFDNPTVETLKKDLAEYVGRQDAYHRAKTIERGVKVCKILFFWDADKNCGEIPTSVSLLGDQFFTDMEHKYTSDIKPNIKTYLKKYHVSYILKDIVLDPQFHPEKLGGSVVYSDNRFELYKLP